MLDDGHAWNEKSGKNAHLLEKSESKVQHEHGVSNYRDA